MDTSEKQKEVTMNNLTASDLGITGETTLKRIKELLAGADMSYMCPCCNRPNRIYKRKITSAMAFGLKLLVDKCEKEGFRHTLIHTETFFKETKDISNSIRADIPKLRFWGLIERAKGIKADGNPVNGYYYVTEAGFQFVAGNLVVPKYIYISNDTEVARSHTEKVNFKQSLNNKFNYNEDITGNACN